MKLDGWSSHYAIREKRNLEKDLFPYFGVRRICEIEAIELLAVIRLVEERGALKQYRDMYFVCRSSLSRWSSAG